MRWSWVSGNFLGRIARSAALALSDSTCCFLMRDCLYDWLWAGGGWPAWLEIWVPVYILWSIVWSVGTWVLAFGNWYTGGSKVERLDKAN